MLLYRLVRLSIVFILLTVQPLSGRAENRAFVVGVNAYSKWSQLKTAINDANAVDEALRASKFVVTRVTDPTLQEFGEKWREFLNSLKPRDLVIFYYGGHGYQVDGANYFALKDTPLPDVGEIALTQASANFYELMQQLQAREPAKAIYVLDACRVSPVLGKDARAKLGQLRGFAIGEEVHSAFVLYSAGAGEEALDYLVDAEKEHNSVYARRLIALLKVKDLGLNTIATRVRMEVEADAKSRKHTQVPAYIDGIRGGEYRWDTLDAADKALSPDARVTQHGCSSWRICELGCQLPKPARTSRRHRIAAALRAYLHAL